MLCKLARNRQLFFCAAALFFLTFVSTSTAQQGAPDPGTPSPVKQQSQTDSQTAPEAPDKRVFGVLPNYRTVQDNGNVEPIAASKKMWIAAKDTFDYPIWIMAAGFAGLYQMENQNPSFGQGTKGYLRRYGTSLADQMMGNILTEGALPVLLHEDPRYFRRGTGSKKSRVWYSATRIFVTRMDTGGHGVNISELLGNSIAVGVSNAYYPDTRDLSNNLQKLGIQLGTDAFSNVLKEFWPDLKRKYFDKHHAPQP